MKNPFAYILLIGIIFSQTVIAQASVNQDTTDIFSYQIYLPVVSTIPCEFCYYIDSQNGSDSYSGTKPDRPWKSLTKLETVSLQPGTFVYLKRGSIWTKNLDLFASGQAGMPITITTYGSGAAPILSNPGATGYYDDVLGLHGNYIIIDNVHIRDSTGAGISIFSDHNIIQYSEINNAGAGIDISGQYNLISHNYIHDLHMVVNTPGGYDDWGANGVQIGSAHNEISFNRFVNCEAPSYDFDTNGGAIEIYGTGDYTSIHHNWSFNTSGFIEVSSDGTGSATNVSIFYNEIINTSRFTYIHISCCNSVRIQNFRVENNSIIDLRGHNPFLGSFIGFDGAPSPDAYIFRNNIVVVSDYWWVADVPFTHQNNIYYLLNSKTQFGWTLDPSEKLANPQFLDLYNYNLHLMNTSPAINQGLDLGYSLDFDLNPVPVFNVPDLGALESQE